MYKLNKKETNYIEEVRNSMGLPRRLLAEAGGFSSTSVFNAKINGNKSLRPEEALRLYNLLGKDQKLEFLKIYSEENSTNGDSYAHFQNNIRDLRKLIKKAHENIRFSTNLGLEKLIIQTIEELKSLKRK